MHINQTDDTRLVTACLEGNEAAWGEVWLRYGPLVKAVARRVGCTADEGRDVLQQVALVALKSLDRLQEPAKLSAWLAGVARYQGLALVRRRTPGEELQPETRIDESSTADALELDQELGLLRGAFVHLDPRCQRLIRRLDLGDPPLSYRQVADQEGLSPTSVGPIRRRCLDRLRKIFERLSRSPQEAHYQGGG